MRRGWPVLGPAWRGALAIAVTAVVYAGAVGVGRALVRQGYGLNLGSAVPLSGKLDVRLSGRTLLPVVVAILAVVLLPVVAARLPWRWLLGVSAVAAAVWAVSLALVDGVTRLSSPIATEAEYLANVPNVDGVRDFLSGFTDHIVIVVGSGQFHWVTHVSGHPPGALLSFVALDRIGLGGPGWAAALCIAAGASSAAAALVTLRAVAGELVARRAAPFLSTAPAAIWIATSADAWFLGVSSWGIALLALAAGRQAGRHGRGGDLLAAGGGLLLGFSLFLSYGLVLLAPVALAAVLARRRVRPLIVGALAVVLVTVAFAAWGFWWLDGLNQTRIRYDQGSAAARPYLYFLVTNLAVLGLAIGPAGVAALARLRRGALAWLPLAGLLGVLIADLSGLSKSEVERIWLPWTPWLLAATAVLPVAHRRWWLAAQLAVGLVVQTVVRANW